ncbi:MAG: hypothetical protein U0075_13180 [Thermomicrobiales bacterium]
MDRMPGVSDVVIARARILPPLPQRDWIPRRALLHALDRAGQTAVAFVIAPAGSGKTGLLTQWTATHREPVAWLSLDERDNSLTMLAIMLAGAVNEAEPDTITTPLRYLEFVTGAPDPDAVATYFLNDLADLTGDLSLVLDDAHLVTDAAATALIQALATAQIPGFRLLLTSRTEPAWPLAALRTSGRLFELRAADLRLSQAKLRDYAERAWDGPVSPEVISTIWENTSGWLAGVRFLCAGSYHPKESAGGVHQADPTHSGEAMGWLLNEALAAYADPARSLLLRLAIPERVTRELAEELAAGLCPARVARETFDALVEDGLFLERATESGWSRVHRHVRQALVDRLVEREGHAAVRHLRDVARTWLTARGLFGEAVALARETGDVAAVAGVIRAAAEPTLAAEGWRTLEQWLADLPPHMVEQDAELLIAAAWVVQHRGDPLRARELAQDAQGLLAADSRPSGPERAILLARAQVVEGGIAYLLGDAPRAHALITDAIPHLDAEHAHTLGQAHFLAALSDYLIDPTGAVDRLASRLASAALLPPLAYVRLWAALGIITYQRGDMRRVTKIAAQMRELGDARGSAWVASWGDALAAMAAYERNDLDAALDHATALLERTRGVHHIAARECLYILSLTYEAKGQWADADLTLERLEAFLLIENTPGAFVDVDALHARFALRRGEPAVARAWFAGAEPPDTTYPSHSIGDARIAHLAVAVALGVDLEAMLARIDEILAAGTMFDTLVRRVEVMLLAAMAHHHLGQADRARAELDAALSLSQPAGLTRVYLDLGSELLPLFDDLLAHALSPPREARRLRDLAAAEVDATCGPAPSSGWPQATRG